MSSEIKEIQLCKAQAFEVSVNLANSQYYSGTITLDDGKATLEVFGEVIENECILEYDHFAGENIDYIYCVNSRYFFHLYDLLVTEFSQRSVYGARDRSSFQIAFSVNYFYLSLAHASSSYPTDRFSSISFHSQTVTNWLGVTQKQLRIIKENSASRLLTQEKELSYEFGVELNENITLSIHYKSSWKRDIINHKIQSEFPPYLLLVFKKEYPNIKELKKITSDLFVLFYVLTGQPITIEKSYVHFPGFLGNSPYFLSGFNSVISNDNNANSLIPFNSKSLFHKENEEKFPIEVFKEYFNLSNNKKDIFNKFYLYDNMKNTEEKFLGLFRVVERLTFVKKSYVNSKILDPCLENFQEELTKNKITAKDAKKLIHKFKYTNENKTHTESAILHFIRELDENIYKKISHLEGYIIKLVRLRNKITHCQPYSVTPKRLDDYNLILNYLSYLLLWREIGLSNHSSYSKLIDFRKYYNIRRIK